MKKSWRYGVAGVVSLMSCLWLPLAGAQAAEWEWTIAPYLWGSDISLDLAANNEPVIGGDVSFSDLLDKIEAAVPVHFEGRAGKPGFFVDVLYLSVGDDSTIPPNPPLPGGTTIHSELDSGFYEAGGLYRFIDDGQALDLLYGARVIDMSQKHDVALPSPSTLTTTIKTSDTLLDGFIGLRYAHSIGDRWDFLIRGDMGAGDTELTWNFIGTFGVRFGTTGTYSMRFGWRYLDVDVETRSTSGIEVETDLVLSGPVVAMVFTL